MKKHYSIISLISLLSVQLFAQEKRTLDWQNFNKSIQDAYIADPVQYGSFAIFEIKNINRFLYKVEIEGKKVSLQTPVPTELQRLFRLDQKQIDELQGTKNEKVEEAKAKVKEEKENMQKIKNSSVAATNQDIEAAIDEVLSKCDEYIKLIDKISLDLADLKIARRSLIVLSQQDVGFTEMSAKLGSISIPNTASIEQTYKTFLTSYAKLDQLYEKAKDEVKKAKDEAVKAKDEAVKAEDEAKKADEEEKKGKIEDSEKKIEKALDTIEESHKIITDEALLDLIEDVMQLSEGLGNPKNFVITAPPVQMLEDISSYQVSIIPTATRSFGVYRSNLSFNFDVPTQGGLKVDFSVGPILSFGNNAKDDKYYYKGDTLRKLDNNNFVTPSIVAMMHFYRRSGRPSSFGGLFGVGAGFDSINDVNLSMVFGVSWVLGKSEKIMLNTGMSILRVSRLKTAQYQEDKRYDISKVKVEDVVEKVFKPSFFLSISYNLTRRVARN